MGDISAVRIDKKSVINQLEHITSCTIADGRVFEFDARVHALNKTGGESHTETATILLRDQGHFLAAILSSDRVPQNLTPESIVRVSGVLVESLDNLQSDTKTLNVQELTVLAEAAPGLYGGVSHGGPGDEIETSTSLDALTLTERLNNRVLDVRVAATGAIFRLMSGMFELTTEFHIANGFQWISTPSIVSYNVEGDNDYFPVSYYGLQNAWLAQTAEFHQQMAMSMDMPRVFEIRNMFRSENDQNSKRRLAEFTMLEVTMAIEHHWHEMIDVVEAYFIFVVRGLQERSKFKHLISLAKRLYSSAGDFKLGVDPKNNSLPRLSFTQAKQLLREQGGIETKDEEDLSATEESLLGKIMRSPSSPHPSDIFVITDYPIHIRSFEVLPNPSNPSTTNSFDFIVRGQESNTGYQQIHDYKKLRKAMTNRTPPLDPDSEMWRPYVSSFEAGVRPHGNYGVGFNRFVQGFLGLADIHETALFPRDAGRIAP